MTTRLAYGVTIAREIQATAGRSVLLGAVYAALDRLEERGLVASRIGDPTMMIFVIGLLGGGRLVASTTAHRLRR